MRSKYTLFYILPALIFLGILYAYPLLLIICHSFQQVSLFGGTSSFIGLDNYIRLIKDPQIYKNFAITFQYTLLTVILKLLAGFLIAYRLNQAIYFKKLWCFLALVPWAVPQVAVAVIWKWIYDGKYGYLNDLLLQFDLIKTKISWLADPHVTFLMVSLVDAWMGWPLIAMMFLAGLEAIPQALYEAASIDGANRSQQFLKITLPNMRAICFVVATLVTIWTFNSFNVIYVLTQGGPLRTTETLMLRVYLESFKNFDFGMSSALSMVIIMILLGLTYPYIKRLLSED